MFVNFGYFESLDENESSFMLCEGGEELRGGLGFDE